LNEIILAILTAFLIWILGFLGNKLFLKRPKIIVSLKDNYNSSSADEDPSNIKIQWNKYIILTNLTKVPAYNINFSNYPKKIKVDKSEMINLDAFEEAKVGFSFVETIDKNMVIQSKDRFIDLIPSYFVDLSFWIVYENEDNKKFYTYFKKNNDLEQSSYHFYKRKNKTSN